MDRRDQPSARRCRKAPIREVPITKTGCDRVSSAVKRHMQRMTFVLWDGHIGGAERVTAALAGELRRSAVDATILFVGDPSRLARQLSDEDVPYASLGLSRGAQVMLRARSLRGALEILRPDAIVTVAVSFLGAALRASGFRGPIIGVEHGELIDIRRRPRQWVNGWTTRMMGVATHDAEVAVSRYMVDLVSRGPRARRVVCIPHGVRMPPGVPTVPEVKASDLTVGFAGRLVPGKGLDRLISAVALLASREPRHRVVLRIAGDGAMRPQWTRLARDLGIADRVQFLGWTDDLTEHWVRCHLAVAPNDAFIESFGMSVVEAMAAGRATIVTNRGGLPELVVPDTTGQVVAAGDDTALAEALAGYLRRPQKVVLHGAAAHRRAADYSLAACAQKYAALASDLVNVARRRREAPQRH
jgi:glycosyltransferase involved in cell wall biosynthesis